MSDEKQPSVEDPRYRWAAERTLLAWLRTGLALMGFGFVVARFGLFLREVAAVNKGPATQHSGYSQFIGVALIIVGIVLTLFAAREHAQIIGRMNRGEAFVPPTYSLGLIFSLVLAAVGTGVAVYLVGLVL